ncbi:MAG: hypothetical protein AAB441_03230 [Patescibacteria group bacterium]
MAQIERIKIETQNTGHKRWIEDGSKILKERLPFKGPAHLAITIGSAGMDSLIDAMGFEKPPVEIPFEEIGLPIGENPNHPKMILAGVTKEDKNIIIVKGRTHEYEIRPTGIATETWGILGPAELSTGYLEILNEVGVENMILTNAAGGINHPLQNGQQKPFSENDIPIVSLIGSDIDLAYLSAGFGHYKGHQSDFFSLKDSDEGLMQIFRNSMTAVGESKEIPTVDYGTSKSTPNFEDPRIIKLMAELGCQVVGMSYSPEKQVLSGLNNIGRFIGISIITNLQELTYKVDKGAAHQRLIISVEEMRNHRAREFEKKYKATDEEVRKNSKKVEKKLSMALAHLAKSI